MNYNYWINDNYWIYKDKFIFKPNFNKPITNYIEIIKDYKILTFENYIYLIKTINYSYGIYNDCYLNSEFN